MKRSTPVKHLVKNGAGLLREGGKHSIYGRMGATTAVPRHAEIMDTLARKIC
ncbi:MAG: addiction module toxin, HicA family [Pseudomonadota bacterium]